jgi:hypothetical protein
MGPLPMKSSQLLKDPSSTVLIDNILIAFASPSFYIKLDCALANNLILQSTLQNKHFFFPILLISLFHNVLTSQGSRGQHASLLVLPACLL